MAAGSESARRALRATIRETKTVALNLASQEIGDDGVIEIAKALADPPIDQKDPVCFQLISPPSPNICYSISLFCVHSITITCKV
jgi:hypothetical protein